MGAILLLLFS